MKKFRVLANLCIAIFLIWICITMLTTYRTYNYGDKTRHVVVMECHDNGTEISLLKFTDSMWRVHIYPVVIKREHSNVSLEMLLKSPYESLDKFLLTLGPFVKTYITEEYHSDTCMLFFITKQMKADEARASEEGKLLVGMVMNQLDIRLPFKLLDRKRDVRFISGEDEIDYLWLSANYERGMFGKKAGSVPRLANETVSVVNLEKSDSNLIISLDAMTPSPQGSTLEGFNQSYVVTQTWFGKQYRFFKRIIPCGGMYTGYYNSRLMYLRAYTRDYNKVNKNIKLNYGCTRIARTYSREELLEHSCLTGWFDRTSITKFKFWYSDGAPQISKCAEVMNIFMSKYILNVTGRQNLVDLFGAIQPKLKGDVVVYANWKPKIKLHYRFNDDYFHYLSLENKYPELATDLFFDAENITYFCKARARGNHELRDYRVSNATEKYCFEAYFTKIMMQALGAPPSWEGVHLYQKMQHAYVATGAVIAMYDRIPFARYAYFTPWSVCLPIVATSCACVVLLGLALLRAQCIASNKVVMRNEQTA